VTTQPIIAATDEQGLLSAVVSGGPVAVLAFIIWFQARADNKQNKEQWQRTCEDLIALRKTDIDSRNANTQSMQELTDVIKQIANRSNRQI